MYETMKAKAAAQIFNRLDTNVVVGVARRMNPEALAGVLARMDPAVAERVTVELAQISERNTGLVNELDAIEPQ
jgi:flagellar motility protein MotE (MotC chaperone)